MTIKPTHNEKTIFSLLKELNKSKKWKKFSIEKYFYKKMYYTIMINDETEQDIFKKHKSIECNNAMQCIETLKNFLTY